MLYFYFYRNSIEDSRHDFCSPNNCAVCFILLLRARERERECVCGQESLSHFVLLEKKTKNDVASSVYNELLHNQIYPSNCIVTNRYSCKGNIAVLNIVESYSHFYGVELLKVEMISCVKFTDSFDESHNTVFLIQ